MATGKSVRRGLKGTVERGLAIPKAAAAEHTRESGPLHGSQHTRGKTTLMEHDLMNKVSGMKEKEFAAFAKRLASLKGKGGG
jgi:hypothetical protein